MKNYPCRITIPCGTALSSSIQTILSVSEFHRFNAIALADFTAGGELRPALKTFYELAYRIARVKTVVKFVFFV